MFNRGINIIYLNLDRINLHDTSLPLRLNHHPRPENHLESVLINCDLVDQPPDQLFIIFLDDRRLLPEKNAHFGISLP